MYGVQRVGVAPRRASQVRRAALEGPWTSCRSSRRRCRSRSRRAMRLQTAAMYCLGVHAAPPVHLLRRPPTQAESGSAMPHVSSGPATTETMRSVARRRIRICYQWRRRSCRIDVRWREECELRSDAPDEELGICDGSTDEGHTDRLDVKLEDDSRDP